MGEINYIEFLKLKAFIKNNKYQKINEWFEKNKISENQELENKITEKIIEKMHSYFYGFNHDKTKIETAILRNLSFKNQLQLLFRAISEINPDHFKELKLTPENKKILKFSENFTLLITDKFVIEKFTEIDKIQEILGFNVMEQKSNNAIFYYETRNIYSYLYPLSTLLKINKPIFSPKFGIIFNYSEDKRKFLEERNIALPTIEEANILYQEMKKTYKGYEFFNQLADGESFLEKIDQSFNEYITIKLNLDLENELQIKNNLKKQNKI